MKVFRECDSSRKVSIAQHLLLNKLRAMLQFVRRVANKFNIFKDWLSLLKNSQFVVLNGTHGMFTQYSTFPEQELQNLYLASRGFSMRNLCFFKTLVIVTPYDLQQSILFVNSPICPLFCTMFPCPFWFCLQYCSTLHSSSKMADKWTKKSQCTLTNVNQIMNPRLLIGAQLSHMPKMSVLNISRIL